MKWSLSPGLGKPGKVPGVKFRKVDIGQKEGWASENRQDGPASSGSSARKFPRDTGVKGQEHSGGCHYRVPGVYNLKW